MRSRRASSGRRFRSPSCPTCAVCPHRGSPIADGTIDLQVVICPLHHHAFSLETGCSSTGAEPLRTFSVQEDVEQNIVLQSRHIRGKSLP
ncbi:Rieske 2Fe-2S domain-containing protein [Pseudarthrobacter sp. AL20]|uniref:Rieske (2Fe-2S) protein n=1 Tax=unclassified Pseudarthrobacter TaxID=2647000 RepID=UPI0032B882C8